MKHIALYKMSRITTLPAGCFALFNAAGFRIDDDEQSTVSGGIP
jgi:hypothetical protein